MHGGQIEAASEGLGRGATFIVTLPLAAQTGLFTTEPLALSATAAAEEVRTEGAIPLPDEPRLEGVCVLVVDDQEDARMALTSFLGKCGVTVTAVSSGARALAILSNSPSDEWPDVLVCDIAMPDEDGYTVLRRVRELEADRGVAPSDQLPAIALTALARSEDRIHALRAGFRVHVAKPIEPAELVVVIANIVGQTS
jgi:CheY-like chemotaxis protein